ncbi:CENP-B homolog protein 2-like [Rhizophagus clarus]|uniref:CENP-B homolog protein 2-like n=1 Tax=Rhizophagus clarus TaxID=94130 RepID=A0A8H3QXB0_9GLOM|nr:CENP-B homolog protein 2-like [Rhizophagus clarus]
MPPNRQRRSVISDDLKRQICEWHREAKFPSLDHAMSLWVENTTAGGVTLTDLLIKEKARVFTQAFNIQESELVFSNGWLEKFKKRNNIQRYRAHREAGSAPLESLAEERMKLRRLLGQFTLDRIYNIDETGLFYRMPPNQTLSTKPILGQKKDKTRITVLLGANVTGTDKLTPWVISNAKRLRPFSRINLERLPIYYRANPKAWMNSTIFEEVLRHMDRNFRAQNKKILLLVDNAPSHIDPQQANPDPDSDNIDDDGSTGAGSRSQHRSRGRRDNNASGREVTQLNLTHVEVAFLPPNTTSHLQPLDAGVIKSFKAHYKRNYCRHILKLFEERKDINKEKVNIKEAVDYLADAWENVSGDTIFNCWVKTGILPSTTDNDIADATQVQQAILNEDVADTNQIIEDLGAESDDPLADSLANALNDFCDLDKEIPTEDVLNENDIIKLIREEMNEENDNSDDSEDEPVLVSLDDATKSLQTWVTFFEQQEIDEFKNEDGHVFKKYLKTVHKLKMQTKKQAQITSFFS